ncbi:unnamed protein product [Fusarium graminearum]|nr:unnamed protein product [Fusarium graminearum]
MLYGSNLLKLIQSFSFASHYFGVGRIGKERNGCRDFTIGSLDQIITKVIPHFDKYPLKTNKYSDYLLFKQVVMMMQRGEHLTAEGLQKIIGIRASLNRGLTPLLLEAFPNTVALLVLRVVMVVLKFLWVCRRSLKTYSYKDYIEFRCQSFKDNYEKILPFFDKYPIVGVKSKDFKD